MGSEPEPEPDFVDGKRLQLPCGGYEWLLR